MLTIRTLPLASLTPAPYNPRKVLSPKSPAYRKLQSSLASFGLVEPLVWNERTGHLVGGHARLRILEALGYAEVPVSVVDLTDEREKALNVVLNNLDAQGRYDSKRLRDLLDPLRDTREFELTGFDKTVFDVLNFEPEPLPETADGPGDRVEITLATDAATFERLRPGLDDLVKAFDVVTHVRNM